MMSMWVKVVYVVLVKGHGEGGLELTKDDLFW